MKKTIALPAAALAALTLALVQPASAQVAVSQTTTAAGTTTQTTSSTGTLTTFDPAAGTVVLSASGGTDPVSYSYSKETTIVDSTGATVAVEAIKPGVPVQVEYVPGDVKIIRRIVVQQPATATTTTVAPVVTEESTTTTTTETVE